MKSGNVEKNSLTKKSSSIVRNFNRRALYDLHQVFAVPRALHTMAANKVGVRDVKFRIMALPLAH